MLTQFNNPTHLTNEIKDELGFLRLVKELSTNLEEFNYKNLNTQLQGTLSLIIKAIESEHYSSLVQKDDLDTMLDLVSELQDAIKNK